MTERSSRSHWESLADQLGADPKSFPQRSQQKPQQQPAKKRTPKARSVDDEAAPADWSDIASKLGITTTSPSKQQPRAQDEAAPRDASVEATPTEPEAAAVEEADDEHDDGTLAVEQAEIRADVESAIEEPDDDEEPDDEEPDDEEEPDKVDVESDTASDVRSADEEQAPGKKRRRRKRRRGGSKRRAEAEVDDDQATEDEEAAAEAETEVADADEKAPSGRRKKRRRRGRKSSRRDDGASAGEDGQADSPLADVEFDADVDDDEGDEGDSDAAAPSGGSRTSHRSITAWEEAIGVIVSANIEARAKRPSGTRGRGRRGRRD